MENTYFGKLIYNDNGEFEIHTDTKIINITKILNDIFDSGLRPLVYIKVMMGDKLLFEESGGLFINIDKFGINCFYICGLNLDALLLDYENEVLEITIKRERKS
jgi:hypothetical protein